MITKKLQLLLFSDSKPMVRGFWSIINACDLDVQIIHIESLNAFQLALKSNDSDFIVCSFNNLRITLQQEYLQIPLFVICHSVEEEKEVALYAESRICDVLGVDHLFRLPFILKREIQLKRNNAHNSSLNEINHFRTLDLIKRSETRLRSIIDGFNDPILISDRFGIVRYANESFTNLLGYHMVDILVQPVHMLIATAHKSEVDGHLETIVKTPGTRRQHQHQVVKANGEKMWVGTTMNHIQDPSGQPMIILHMRDITDQITLNHQKEEVILYEKKSRELIERILEGISDAFISIDLNGKLIFINKHASELLREEREDLLGENFLRLQSSLFDQLKPRISELLHHPKDCEDEIYDDEHKQWYEARCYCRNDGINIYLHNITDRIKRAELKKESDELFEKSFMKSPNAILIVDAETRQIVTINNKFIQESGYSSEEAIGKTTTELGLWDNMEEALAHLDLLETSGFTKNYKFLSVNKDGEKRHAIISAERLEYKGKSHYLAVVRDIHEMVEAQENLRLSEERYQLAIQGANDGLWDWNIAEDLAYFSPRCKELLGLDDQVEIFATYDVLMQSIHEEDAPLIIENTRLHFKTKQPFSAEIRAKTSIPNAFRWVLIRGQALWDENGKAIRMAGSISDINQRRMLEDVLRQKNADLQAAQNKLLATQVELEVMNERFDVAVDAANEGIWDWNLLTNEEYLSPKWYEICGIQQHDNAKADYQLWESRVHPDYLALVRKSIEDHLAHGIPYSVEYLHRHENGEYRWQKSTGRALKNEQGENVRMVGSIRDITDKRQELEEVVKREQIQNAILSALPDLLFRTTADGVILDYSSPSQDHLYSKPEDFLNRKVNEILPMPLGQELTDAFGKVHADKKMHRFDYGLSLGGSLTYYEARIVPVGENEVLSVIRDVTSQKLAEQDLVEEQVFTDQVISNMQHGFSMVDNKGVHVRVNESLCEMTGYSESELIGSGPPHMYWPEEEYDKIHQALEDTLAGRAKSFELIFKRKDGQRFPVSLTPSQILDKNNQIVRSFAVIKDISERKMAEEQIRYKNNLLESVAMVGTLLLTNEEWIPLLERSFHIIGKAMNVDSIFYFEVTAASANEEKIVNHCVSWNIQPDKTYFRIPDYQNTPWSFYDAFINDLASNYQFERFVRDFPEGHIRAHLEELSVQSILILPIFQNLELIGFIGFEECKSERKWLHSELTILRIIINNIVTALERRASEEKILLSNERYEYVSKATFDAIWDYDIRNNELFWGENFHKLLGYDTTDVVQNLGLWENNIHPLEKERVLQSFQSTIDGSETLWESNYRFKKANGEYSHIRDKGLILRDESGFAYRMIGAMSDMTEFVEAQNSLIASDKDLRRAQEAARLGSWNYDLTTQNFVWTDEMYRIYEVDRQTTENLVDLYLARLYPDDVAQVFRNIESGVDYQFHHPIILPDGRVKHIACYGYFTKNDKGENISLNGTAQDVTDNKLAEEAIKKLNNELEQKVIERTAELQLSQANLLEAQRIAGLGSWQLDMSTGKFECSEIIYAFIGYQPHQGPITKEQMQALIGMDGWHKLTAIINEAVDAKGSFETDIEFKRPDGKTGYLALSGRPMYDKNDVHTHLAGVAINITERKNIELKIEEQRNTFLHVLEQSLAGYFDWLFHEDYEYMSPTLKGLFGYAEDEMENKPAAWQRLIFEEDLPNKLEELQKHIDSKGAYPYQVESRFRHKNGSTVWIICKGTVIEWGPNGEALRMVGCHIDITRQKEIETSLKKNRQALESFSYSVSHDLRAPLRGIDGWSLALLEDYGAVLDETALLYLNRVRSETQRMGVLIDEMLKLSRIGQKQLVWSPLNISQLVDKVIDQQKVLHPDIAFELEIQKDLSTWGDSNLLEIMLTNLIANSIKFSNDKTTVHLKFGMTTKDTQIVYYLQDRGIGFDMGNANKLFGVFQRLHSGSEYPGSGIGLAIVQRIVHLHQGTIWADSEINVGTCFYFTINK